MKKRSKKPRKSRAKKRSALPKGAYRVPGGGYMLDKTDAIHISKDGKRYRRSRAVFKENMDYKKLANALLDNEIHKSKHREGVKYGQDPNPCEHGCRYYDQLMRRAAQERIRDVIRGTKFGSERAVSDLKRHWQENDDLHHGNYTIGEH